MKNKVGLFIAGCLAFFLTACLGSDDPITYQIDLDCRIISFRLNSDSIPGLKKVKFTIDQANGKIFNIDSLPYGTKVDSVACIITYNNSTSIYANKVRPQATGDTILWQGTDSIYINFSKPVTFEVTAIDQSTTKTYQARVNIHQVNSDSLAWSLYNNKILNQNITEQKVVSYTYNNNKVYFMYSRPNEAANNIKLHYSNVSDMNNWEELTLRGLPAEGIILTQITVLNNKLYATSYNGVLYSSTDGQNWVIAENRLPSVKYILGTIKNSERQPLSVLSTIISHEGALTFAAMNENSEWKIGEKVPEKFPLTGFANCSYYNMHNEYLMLATGRDQNGQQLNTTWSTMNGETWALLTNEGANYFTKKEGAILTYYDDKFFLIGGIDESNVGTKNIHCSIDHGLTWAIQDTLVVLPEQFTGRGFSSIIVDEDNYINIFGGKTSGNSNDLNEIWRGRINRLGFKK
ncbi:DUF6242 domain-containing protein [Parabacteroides sp. OttesenSCG-928-G21]|nr:DUF6242 domain-containing protein [Parabacteroides sp. OttesenSCG-928-G21]